MQQTKQKIRVNIKDATIVIRKEKNEVAIHGFIKVPGDPIPRSIYMAVDNIKGKFGKGYVNDMLIDILQREEET